MHVMIRGTGYLNVTLDCIYLDYITLNYLNGSKHIHPKLIVFAMLCYPIRCMLC